MMFHLGMDEQSWLRRLLLLVCRWEWVLLVPHLSIDQRAGERALCHYSLDAPFSCRRLLRSSLLLQPWEQEAASTTLLGWWKMRREEKVAHASAGIEERFSEV